MYRCFPSDVTFPDGRQVSKALVLDQGMGVGIYAQGEEGEPTKTEGIVRVAFVEGATVEVGGPGWVLQSEDGLIGIAKGAGCGCGQRLARWAP